MAVNNYSQNELLLAIDRELNNAYQEIESENRLVTEAEIRDATQEVFRQSHWIQRLHIGSAADLYICRNWIKGIIQHACAQAIVMVSAESIWIANPNFVTFVRNIPHAIQPPTHAQHRCWPGVLRQVHDVKVIIDSEIVAGSVAHINLDAFDMTGSNAHLTIPWHRVSLVEITL